MSSFGDAVHLADGLFDASGPQKRKQRAKPGIKYTKIARFPGQATFDLANDMNQLPFSKSRYKTPHVPGVEFESSPDIGPPCVSCGVTTQPCSCDPLMNELNELEREARSQSMPSNSPPPPPRISTCFHKETRDFGGTTMLLQPETRPITQEQLVKEVKGIYAGLVMVEKKCVEIDRQQAATTDKLSNEQWQALIALHRTLLHEHHDFFMASQHPSASPALRRLATKYAMPPRMWEHGINSFLKLLRHEMPGTAKHMLAYIRFAYSILEKLSTQVPSLAQEWVECIDGLHIYYKELQKITEATCTSCLSESTGDAADPVLCPHCMEHHYQTSTFPDAGEKVDFFTQSGVYDGLYRNDGILGTRAKANGSSSSFQSTGTDGDSQANTHRSIPEADMNRIPWGTTLSRIASLVLAGWLWVGQAESFDKFNIYVKVFCILAMTDLGCS